MRLPISALLYQISNTYEYEIANIDTSSCYEGIHLFTDDTTVPIDRRYLYFITDKSLNIFYSNILHNPEYLGCTFICLCSDNINNYPSLYPELSVAYVFSKDSFSVVFNRITNIYMHFDSWDKNLHLKLLQGNDMQNLMDLTAPILSHPMLIFDLNLSVIASFQPENETETIMDELVEAGYATPDTVKTLRKLHILPQTFDHTALHTSAYPSSCGFTRYSMFYPLIVANQTFGYALVFCCQSHPSSSYQYLMDMVIENLILYFRQERFSIHLSSEKYEAFLPSLLENESLSDKQIKTQLSFIPNLKLNDHFQLATVSFKEQHKIPYSFICWSLRNSFQNLKPFMYQNTLYILRDSIASPSQFNHFVPEDMLHLFIDCFSGADFFCSISQPFFSLLELPHVTVQCQTAENQAMLSRAKQLFYYYSDYALEHMITLLSHVEDFDSFTSPYYVILRKYDEEHSTDLTEVFMRYLENGRNINQTSNVIFMHRNTVLNKIKKATSIMGNDFEEYQTRFFYMLTYLHEHN